MVRHSQIEMVTAEKKQIMDGVLPFTKKKSKGLEYLDLSEQSRGCFGRAGSPDDRVFYRLEI